MAVLPPRQIGALIAETGAFGINLSNASVAVPFLDTAIAVCLAESGGNTAAKNSSSSASGLWQIMASVHGSLIASQRAIYGAKKHKNLDVFDPHVNTACAGQLYKERGWQPWVAYTSGSYKRHTGHGGEAYAYLTQTAGKKGLKGLFDGTDNPSFGDIRPGSLLAGAAENGAENVQDAVAGFSPGAAVDKALNFLKDAGVVIGVALFAVVLVVLGVWFIASQSSSVKRAVNATPVGRVTKLVK